MNNKIRVETEADTLCLVGNEICAFVHSKEHIFGLSSVMRMVVFTTDSGPLQDDMGLAIEVENGDVIMIMSEHKCFSPFLFEQIGKALPVDYQGIIDASASTSNGVFEIYVKDGLREGAAEEEI